jgi:hypothetical protein
MFGTPADAPPAGGVGENNKTRSNNKPLGHPQKRPLAADDTDMSVTTNGKIDTAADVISK